MSNIEVPYLPVNRFDALDVLENFTETQPENLELNDEMNASWETCEEDDLKNIELILIGMGMEKYLKLFQKSNLQLDTLMQLDETDLEELGVSDPKDRKILAENLGFCQTKENEFVIPENHLEDYKIFQNALGQLVLAQSYCAYVDLQLKKENLTDYKINEEETAGTYLKAFTESALIQSQIMSKKLYDHYGFDSLIDNLVRVNHFYYPDTLPKKKTYRREYLLKAMIVIGLSSLLFFTGKRLMRRWIS